jgi:hypothetical protein
VSKSRAACFVSLTYLAPADSWVLEAGNDIGGKHAQVGAEIPFRLPGEEWMDGS